MKRSLSSHERHILNKWWLFETLQEKILGGPHAGIITFHAKDVVDGLDADAQCALLEQIGYSGNVIEIVERIDAHTYKIRWEVDFHKQHEKYRQLATEIEVDNGGEVKFDDDKAQLNIGARVCQLPPYKNEHFLCQVLFRTPAGEWHDKAGVIEDAFGDSDGSTDVAKRKLKDTCIRLNRRVEDVLRIDKFVQMHADTITRLR